MKSRILLVTIVALFMTLFLGACSGSEDEVVEETAVSEVEVIEEPTDAPTDVPPTDVPPTEEPTEVPPTEVPTVEPTEEPAPEPTEEPLPAWIPPAGALVAVPATNAPTLDGSADDAVWADATAIEVLVEDGANEGDGTVSIKSAYTDDMVYFLVTWNDPTESYLRSPWVKQDDGTWAALSDPDNRGGDNNLYYEDKMSFIWPIDNSIPQFETKGCLTGCHAGDDSEFKPYGNKNTELEGEMGDIWHWKSVRNVNQVDDQYLDSTKYSADTPSAGRHGDPSDGGGYVNNKNEEGTLPAFMGLEGAPVDGSPGYIMDGEEQPFDDSLFVAGDMIPGVVKAAFTGDRGDLSAGWVWADGVWTLEIGRALETGSEYDVQYDDLTAMYNFGVAIFENAQVRHAYQYGVNEFVFQPTAGMSAETPAPVETEANTDGSLVSVIAANAPTLDGSADDAVWANATALEVLVEDGANEGDGTVSIKSAYTDDMIYFLVTWNDPTQSYLRSPWVKQDDGTWAALSDPDNRGGDNNLYYEDKMAFIWPVDNSIPQFETKGCMTGCHAGDDSEFKPYGNKNTDLEGEVADIWHWKSVRNVAQMDDQYLDSTKYSAETPSAGRHGDPSDGGGYVNNKNEEGTLPAFMGPEGAPVDGSPGYIMDGEQLPFDDSLFVAGDMVPGIVKAAFLGDRGDLSAGWEWVDGVWTLEIGRALVTGSDYDVQYDDLTAPYNFGVAIFENAQVRHAYQYGTNTLTFEAGDGAAAPAAPAESDANVLGSVNTTEAPTLDGLADDAIWAEAVAMEVLVEDGANEGDGMVSVKSAYTDDMVYFLVTWYDPTESYLRSPWVKQDDGTWAALSDPDNRGGDNNLYYEDKMAFIWTIDNSIPQFETKGCMTGCHAGDDSEFKPYGNKNTDLEDEMADIWHWKSVRNVAQMDDQYLDSTKYSAETPSAGRHGDPSDGGGYVHNENEDNTLPAFMGPLGYPIDGSPGYIMDGEQLPFDDSLFVAGDMVPGIVKAAFLGDRGDLSAGWVWADGVWTLEIGRALVTGSDYDVQYDDLDAPYYFGVAVFENAQVRHAYQYGVNEMIFLPAQ